MARDLQNYRKKDRDRTYWGPIGTVRFRHFWQLVRIKRSQRKGTSVPGADCGPIKVQKRSYGPSAGSRLRWVTIGTYATENEAVEVMENEVYIMKLAEEMKEMSPDVSNLKSDI